MESAAHANATIEPNALLHVPFVGLDGHVIMLLYYGHPDDLRCVTVFSQYFGSGWFLRGCLP
ncbi:hypothetical protein CY34DRAFT_813352, partial [Suillus luteus UH-Slu-Lm8-n1]